MTLRHVPPRATLRHPQVSADGVIVWALGYSGAASGWDIYLSNVSVTCGAPTGGAGATANGTAPAAPPCRSVNVASERELLDAMASLGQPGQPPGWAMLTSNITLTSKPPMPLVVLSPVVVSGGLGSTLGWVGCAVPGL